MATGDITVTINPDGWTANLSVAGFTSGATYGFGMATNNIPGASTPFSTAVSLGYDTTGVATTISRTVYLTKVVRFPFGTGFLTGLVGTGTFTDGETITQAVSGATGKIVGAQASGTKLIFFVTSGTFNNVNLCTGGTSSATFTSTSTFTTYVDSTPHEIVTAVGVTVRVALSDYVFQKDNTGGGNSGTSPTVTIPAAFVTNSGGASQTSNALSAAVVTQSSTAAYPKVVGNWAWPGFQRVTGSTVPLRAVAFHSSGISCMKFSVADTHSNTATSTTTAPTYDNTAGDAVPVVEYIGAPSTSTLTALDVLTCNFIAYPVVGDSGAILDTSGGTTAPSALFGPIKMLCDKSATYGVTKALVDPGAADDSTGVAYDTGSWNEGTAAPFKTIGGAGAAISAYNNTNHSRADCGGGVIYLKDGNNVWTGSSNINSTPDTWLTITRAASSSSRAACKINSQSGSTRTGFRTLIQDVTISPPSGILIDDAGCLWLDNCTINASGATVYTGIVWYVTRCTVPAIQAGLYPYATENSPPAIIRGNDLSGAVYSCFCYTFLGNLKTGATATTEAMFSLGYSGQTVPATSNSIIAFNKIMGFQCDSTTMLRWHKVNPLSSRGLAIVQNLLENYYNGPSSIMEVAADDSTAASDPVNNVIYWNNTIVGQRANLSYNDKDSEAPVRKFWSLKNNIFEDYNIKTDTFTSNGGANGARVGNWPCLYGVGYSGNLIAECANIGAPGTFLNEFPGLKSYQPAPLTPNVLGYVAFTNRKASTGLANGTGDGTYTLTSTSPALALQRDLTIPYDLSGTARTATDAAGVYHFSAPSSGFFFAQ